MKDDLGDRMKGNYESRSKVKLCRRVPVIIRIDGRAFSKFCRRFEYPFDQKLHDMLNEVTLHLCKNIQGVKFAERHSDEISLLLTDYDKITTDAFFDYEVQKICSVVASMATAEFCKRLIANEYLTYEENWPQFDARCFNIPESDIDNYFLWRIKDAQRNSIGMYARSMFSHKDLHGKNSKQMIEMMSKKGRPWGRLPQERKTGYIFLKDLEN